MLTSVLELDSGTCDEESHRFGGEELGRIVERHDLNGFYDQIELRTVRDRHFGDPSPAPRIRLNRPGSAWVFAHTGQPRWTWREIWNHLAAGGVPDDAAATIAAIAGLGPLNHM